MLAIQGMGAVTQNRQILSKECNTDNLRSQDCVIDPDIILPIHIQIGSGVIIERGVVFSEGRQRGTVIQSNVIISAGCVIGPDVEIGWGARLMPGSVILTPVPPNAIVQGNPAKIIGYTHSLAGEGASLADGWTPASGNNDSREHRVTQLGVGEAALHFMPRIIDMRGALTVGEIDDTFPFRPKRYFAVFDVPIDALRGEHAHRECHEFLICVHGSCCVHLDDGFSRREIILDRPDIGLHLPPMIWATEYRYTKDAVLVVLASHPYSALGYIRNYDDFRREVTGERD